MVEEVRQQVVAVPRPQREVAQQEVQQRVPVPPFGHVCAGRSSPVDEAEVAEVVVEVLQVAAVPPALPVSFVQVE